MPRRRTNAYGHTYGLRWGLRWLLAQYEESCARSRSVVAAATSFDQTSVATSRKNPGQHFTLRWIMLHMIEETARHNGHADLIRESIDGLTGE